MKTLLKAVLLGALITTLGAMEISTMEVAIAQTPDNPDRKENTRQRENPERRDQPAERNNPEREDPLLSAELQICYAVPEAEKERCIIAAKRKFGQM